MSDCRLRLLSVVMSFILAAPAGAQMLLTDDFDYPVADSLEGLGSWFRSGVNSPYNIRVVSPGLVFPGHPGSGIGNAVLLTNEQNGDIVKHNFPVRDSASIYLSVLMSVDSMTATATQGFVAGFDQSGGTTALTARLMLRRVSSTKFQVGVGKAGHAPAFSDSVFHTMTTYLVVVKYTWVAGTTLDDTVKIFVFSSTIPTHEPVAGVETTEGIDAIDAGQVYLTSSYANSGGLEGSPVRIDGMRVSTSWEGAVLTVADETAGEVPVWASLDQNYPNPFNPATTILYALPQAGHVTLRVYNVLGEEAATLVEQGQSAGTFTARWDASGKPSGIYFYRLISGTYVQTRKMVLMK